MKTKPEDPKNDRVQINLSKEEKEFFDKVCNDIPQAKRIIFKFGMFKILKEGVHDNLKDMHNNLINLSSYETTIDTELTRFSVKIKEEKK